MRRAIIIFFLYLVSISLMAQNISDHEYIRIFLGVDGEEDIDPYEVERMEGYLSRPLCINILSFDKLLTSGLLTQYQVASFYEYKKESGDVLSMSELASVDGFGEDFVKRLAPFISLKSLSLPGSAAIDRHRLRHETVVRAGYRKYYQEEALWNQGIKYRMSSDKGLGLSLSYSKPYDEPEFASGFVSGNLEWNFKRSSAKVVLGDFNARFGQGLGFWNGMMLSGLSSISSLYRKGAGISETWSFTGSSALTGIAASIPAGRFVISALTALPGIKEIKETHCSGILPAINIAWYGRYCQFSVTEYMEFSYLETKKPIIPHMKTSADVRMCLKGTDVFAEVAYDWINSVPAFLCGTVFPVSGFMRMAAQMRVYPEDFDSYMCAAPRSGSKCSNEAGLSLAGEITAGENVAVNGAEGFGSSVVRHKGTFCIDAVVNPESKSSETKRSGQMKVLFSWQSMLSPSLRMTCRITERFRSWESDHLRSDLRLDLSFLSRHFLSNLRVNFVECQQFSFLAYLEGGYVNDSFTAYLRQGVFIADNWSDRIYAYERDIPGSFSVPAYYGRGVWTAMNCSWRFARWGRIYARASLLSYPMMPVEKKKPGKAELKLQMSFYF